MDIRTYFSRLFQSKIVTKGLFPVVLFVLPFWNANEGVDYADIGYSLNNYADYENLGITWKLATYLANCLGRFFMWLPGGDTLLGMNLYTSVLISVMAVAAYFFCYKKAGAVLTFVGEVLAVSLCWCPTVILYNYLTYVLVLAALIFLYIGLVKRRKWFLSVAGVFLGINVFVRFSNLAETAFILLVWYAAWLSGSKRDAAKDGSMGQAFSEEGQKMSGFLQRAFQDTLWCFGGYAAGFFLIFLIVCTGYGLDAYGHMLTGMSSMEQSGARYSVWGMLTGPFSDYLGGCKWLLLLLVYMAVGYVLFRILPGRFEGMKKVVFLAGMVLVYRYFWGHAMFSFNYYSYGAMFWPTILILVSAIGLGIYRLFRKNSGTEERLLAALVLLVIFVTPLGSNNRSYPVMNNLFLVLPFALLWGTELLKRMKFPARAVAGVYFLFFSVQILLFGAVFTFGDGSPEQKRDAKIENNGILRGIKTTSEKADVMERLTEYYAVYGGGRELVCYGNIPAFPYYLKAGTAIGSAWPDLDTYAMYDYRADMQKLYADADAGKYPVILVNAGLDEEDLAEEKYVLLQQFIEENGYCQTEWFGDILVFDRKELTR
ncbi:MAG: hypothetical protein GX234_06455 [Clostridiales bacterium]|nr:hypothetical protein [Clostridiales bacterium]